MNEKQKKVLMVVGAVVLGMLLYPPFHMGYKGSYLGQGYSFLFNPPINSSVDAGTLFAQWVGVLIIGGIAFFLLRDD